MTAVDVAEAAVRSADVRLREAGCRDRVTLAQSSIDAEWPSGPFDLLVLSEVAYYLDADTLARCCDASAPDCDRMRMSLPHTGVTQWPTIR